MAYPADIFAKNEAVAIEIAAEKGFNFNWTPIYEKQNYELTTPCTCGDSFVMVFGNDNDEYLNVGLCEHCADEPR